MRLLQCGTVNLGTGIDLLQKLRKGASCIDRTYREPFVEQEYVISNASILQLSKQEGHCRPPTMTSYVCGASASQLLGKIGRKPPPRRPVAPLRTTSHEKVMATLPVEELSG